MKEIDVDVIEEIYGRKISEFIKKNKNLEKKELVKEIQKMLDQKDEVYNMSDEEIEKILKAKK